MRCDPPLSDKGGQEGTDNSSDMEEMPSQDEQMSCDPPQMDNWGQEGTNGRHCMEMEWSPDPECGDLGLEKEGEW